MYDLSAFQRDTLFVLSGNGHASGTEIRAVLDDYYETTITGGRLYPSLDELVDSGLVDKGRKDDRTNEYSITKRGERELNARRDWEDGLVEICINRD